MPLRLVLDVDTGTDDAGALLWAATAPDVELVAVISSWGNCSRDQAARNTLAVLGAAGRSDVPVFLGSTGPVGPVPAGEGATLVMGNDGLGDLGIADRVFGLGTTPAQAGAQPEDGHEALSRLAARWPGELTLLAVAPLSTVARAIAAEPALPGNLKDLVVMGGAVAVGGNLSAVAEANVGNDPLAAQQVVAAFGTPGALASGSPPRLVPLDVTLAAPLTRSELDAVGSSPLPGAGLLHDVWSAIWAMGRLETGQDDVWPCHDLLAAWCAAEPEVCDWVTVPLAVDCAGGPAWGATVADRRILRYATWADSPGHYAEILRSRDIPANRWLVALGVDGDRYRAGVREWLAPPR